MVAILSANQFTDGGEGCDEGTELSSLLVCYAFDGMSSRMYLDHDGVIKWNIFRVSGPLCREFIGDRWIPRTMASDAERWCFLLSTPE